MYCVCEHLTAKDAYMLLQKISCMLSLLLSDSDIVYWSITKVPIFLGKEGFTKLLIMHPTPLNNNNNNNNNNKNRRRAEKGEVF